VADEGREAVVKGPELILHISDGYQSQHQPNYHLQRISKNEQSEVEMGEEDQPVARPMPT